MEDYDKWKQQAPPENEVGEFYCKECNQDFNESEANDHENFCSSECEGNYNYKKLL
jgi:hypothetical protein